MGDILNRRTEPTNFDELLERREEIEVIAKRGYFKRKGKSKQEIIDQILAQSSKHKNRAKVQYQDKKIMAFNKIYEDYLRICRAYKIDPIPLVHLEPKKTANQLKCAIFNSMIPN